MNACTTAEVAVPAADRKRARSDDLLQHADEDDSVTCESPVRKRRALSPPASPVLRRRPRRPTRSPLEAWVAQRDRPLPPAAPQSPPYVSAADAGRWAVVADWLVELYAEYGLREETLFRAHALLQRVYGRMRMRVARLQLVAVAALHVAGKQEEMYPPLKAQHVYMTDHAYTLADVDAAERELLAFLEYRLLPATEPEWFSAWGVPAGPLRTCALRWALHRRVHHWDAHARDCAESLAAAALASAAAVLGVPPPAQAAGAAAAVWPAHEYETRVAPWLRQLTSPKSS